MLVQHKTKNLLIIKDDIGKAKPSVRKLPGEGHSYGYAPQPDKEGVGQRNFLINYLFSADQLDSAQPVEGQNAG